MSPTTARRPQATAAETTTPIASAMKLDWEYENTSPTQIATTTRYRPDAAQPADAAENDPRERDENRDREIAPVDRRIPEDGVDAEERRVGVPDDDARVPEHVPGDPLVHADRGVGERGQDERRPRAR